MPPHDINVNITNWRTGTNITIARYLVDVSGTYRNDAGAIVPFSQTVTFPDILAQLSAADQKALAREIMYRALRVIAGIDSGINGGVT